MRRYDKLAFGEGTGLVSVDHETPDRLVAKAEPLHETDADFDADLAPDDDGECISLAGIKDIPRDALLKLILWLIPSESNSGSMRWQIATKRLAVVAQALDADGIGRMSYEDLAGELGCTRAILSWHAVRMLDSLGVEKFRSGKPRRSRETYRASAIESHRRRGNKLTQAAEQTHSASE